ncbi:uncharacterized protein LOC143428203 [Xylocopa sonorina]|uniref:uncharacterized protein LOC143428203 n=1 Tax=Xylocopa sonorina TaxID=1818115 RepID=UPI00403AF7C8
MDKSRLKGFSRKLNTKQAIRETETVLQTLEKRTLGTTQLTRGNLAEETMHAHTSRVTMGPCDFLSKDVDSNDIELKLLYDQYLQKIMTQLILKKKQKETEKLFLSQLATIDKEYDRNKEKLFKLKARELDIINLTKIQNDIDSQLSDVKADTKREDIETVKNILSQLCCLLQPLDALRLDNIILPDTPEEREEMYKTLKSCSETLKSIINLIGDKNETYQSVNNGLKEFTNTFNDVQDHQKRLEKELCTLQGLVLKSASMSLNQNHN